MKPGKVGVDLRADVEGGDAHVALIGKAKPEKRIKDRERLQRLLRIKVVALLFVGEVEPRADDGDARDVRAEQRWRASPSALLRRRSWAAATCPKKGRGPGTAWTARFTSRPVDARSMAFTHSRPISFGNRPARKPRCALQPCPARPSPGNRRRAFPPPALHLRRVLSQDFIPRGSQPPLMGVVQAPVWCEISDGCGGGGVRREAIHALPQIWRAVIRGCRVKPVPNSSRLTSESSSPRVRRALVCASLRMTQSGQTAACDSRGFSSGGSAGRSSRTWRASSNSRKTATFFATFCANPTAAHTPTRNSPAAALRRTTRCARRNGQHASRNRRA